VNFLGSAYSAAGTSSRAFYTNEDSAQNEEIAFPRAAVWGNPCGKRCTRRNNSTICSYKVSHIYIYIYICIYIYI